MGSVFGPCLVTCILYPSSLAIILMGKGELMVFILIVFLMSCNSQCSVTLLAVPWVGLRCVIVVFTDHTHLFFGVHQLVKTTKDSVFCIP